MINKLVSVNKFCELMIELAIELMIEIMIDRLNE